MVGLVVVVDIGVEERVGRDEIVVFGEDFVGRRG